MGKRKISAQDSLREHGLDEICRGEDRMRLRETLLDGARSNPSDPTDASYFAALRERVANSTSKKHRAK